MISLSIQKTIHVRGGYREGSWGYIHPLKNTFSFSAFLAPLIILSEQERCGMFTISSTDHAKILKPNVGRQTHSKALWRHLIPGPMDSPTYMRVQNYTPIPILFPFDTVHYCSNELKPARRNYHQRHPALVLISLAS